VARYLYALLTPTGLRYMTPTVVYAELLAAPVTLLGSYMGNRKVVLYTIGMICSLHIGIALTVRNTVLLSSVACAAWCVFLPTYRGDNENGNEEDNGNGINNNRNDKNGHDNKGSEEGNANGTTSPSTCTHHNRNQISIISYLVIIPLVCGCIWFETISEECNQSMKHIWSVLLHNRWNVFVGAEEYVTWEIAPGKLADGSVVDVWGRKDYVEWAMPGTGAPCTSTARPGRWRSFPYLAELDGEDGEALWSYLCRQWDRENGVSTVSNSNDNDNDNNNDSSTSSASSINSHRKLLRFNFFMLQADVLPNMGFSSTRKRLIKSYDCTKLELRGGKKRDEDIHIDPAAAGAQSEL